MNLVDQWIRFQFRVYILYIYIIDIYLYVASLEGILRSFQSDRGRQFAALCDQVLLTWLFLSCGWSIGVLTILIFEVTWNVNICDMFVETTAHAQQ